MSVPDHCRDQPHALFISDLHLAETHPMVAERFERFCVAVAPPCTALYILGDLFEFWVGDDTIEEPFNRAVCNALARIVESGVPVNFMHGNRDFLAGDRFAEASKACIISDPWELTLWGVPTLLMHGDALCTEDVSYQAFRRHVRDPQVQHHFLSLPVDSRKAQVGQTRAASEREKQGKAHEIMDVAEPAVHAVLREHDYARLIHGHTHRPATHQWLLDGHLCSRWVLSDWTEQRGDVLFASQDGLVRFPVA